MLLPIIAIWGYLNYPQEWRIHPTTLHYVSIVHNTVLITFSAWTAVSLTQVVYKYEANQYFQHADFDRIIYYFYLSKYYELFDTVLIYLQGKPVVFLQKYHHVGAIVTWYLSYTYKVESVWVTTLGNSCVHTIMYAYYLATLLKLNQVKQMKIYITSIQLLQFVVLVPYATAIYHKFDMVSLVCNLYTFGLILLFSEFYYKTYISAK